MCYPPLYQQLGNSETLNISRAKICCLVQNLVTASLHVWQYCTSTNRELGMLLFFNHPALHIPSTGSRKKRRALVFSLLMVVLPCEESSWITTVRPRVTQQRWNSAHCWHPPQLGQLRGGDAAHRPQPAARVLPCACPQFGFVHGAKSKGNKGALMQRVSLWNYFSEIMSQFNSVTAFCIRVWCGCLMSVLILKSWCLNRWL